MTDRQYNQLHKIVTDGTTIAQLKAIIKLNKLGDVDSTNTNGYNKLKEDYVRVTMNLLTGYNPFQRSFVLHTHFLLNIQCFPKETRDNLLEWII